jgi:hypothetical protein
MQRQTGIPRPYPNAGDGIEEIVLPILAYQSDKKPSTPLVSEIGLPQVTKDMLTARV